jgi:hypothetical protein
VTTEGKSISSVGGWTRVLALLLNIWEPLSFAMVAAGAFNAIAVRGIPVVLVLLARLGTTALCVAAGRALQDRRPAAPSLTKAALILAAGVQLFAYVTPYFPSNRPPGETPLYVGWTVVYYAGWLLYVQRSRRFAALFG